MLLLLLLLLLLPRLLHMLTVPSDMASMLGHWPLDCSTAPSTAVVFRLWCTERMSLDSTYNTKQVQLRKTKQSMQPPSCGGRMQL